MPNDAMSQLDRSAEAVPCAGYRVGADALRLRGYRSGRLDSARSASPISSVSYLDPPPELTLRPLASLPVPAEESGSYSVAVGDLGVAVSQWTYSDDSVQRLDVVDFSGQSRNFPNFGGNALLAYGPGDVLYMTQQGTSIEEFAVVAVALGADGATEVRRERENVNLFLEYPPMSFGHTATGVVHRREYLADESPIIDYVDIDGQPATLADAPPTFRFETAEQAGAGLGGMILSSLGTSWTVAVDAAPDRGDSYVGISPPSPGTDGHGIYVRHIGSNVDPSTDFGAPSGWVIADLQPGGTATWWSVPDGWEVVASNAWGTVLGRRTGTTLELALADFPTAGICPNPPDFEPSGLPAGFTNDLVAGQGGQTTIQPDGQIAPIEPVNPDVYHYAGEPGTFINITAGTIPALTATNTEQITVLDSPAILGEIADGHIAELHTTCGTYTFVAAGISRADFETFLTGLQPA